ncbi:hypothetical protein ACFSJY_12720 [Thalassotalea euphylliae]|uniref:hypothetical protein n=1 Tax=Thalassotalea euphylliae TaxID=1655234 RepID=UPI00362DC94D
MKTLNSNFHHMLGRSASDLDNLDFESAQDLATMAMLMSLELDLDAIDNSADSNEEDSFSFVLGYN